MSGKKLRRSKRILKTADRTPAKPKKSLVDIKNQEDRVSKRNVSFHQEIAIKEYRMKDCPKSLTELDENVVPEDEMPTGTSYKVTTPTVPRKRRVSLMTLEQSLSMDDVTSSNNTEEDNEGSHCATTLLMQPSPDTSCCSRDGDQRVFSKEDEMSKMATCSREMSLTLTDCGTKSRNQAKPETQTKSVHSKRIKTSTDQRCCELGLQPEAQNEDISETDADEGDHTVQPATLQQDDPNSTVLNSPLQQVHVSSKHAAIGDDLLHSKMRALDLNLEAMPSVESFSVGSPVVQVVNTTHDKTVDDTCRCVNISNVLDKSIRRESVVSHNVIKQFAAVANVNKSLYLEQEYLEQQVLGTTGAGEEGAEDMGAVRMDRHHHDGNNDATERQHGVVDTSAHDLADPSGKDTPSATTDIQVQPLPGDIPVQPLAGDISVQPLASSDILIHLSSSASDISTSVQPDASTGTAEPLVDTNTDAPVASATIDEVLEPSSVSNTPLQSPANTSTSAQPSADAPILNTTTSDVVMESSVGTDDAEQRMDYSSEDSSGTNKNMESSTASNEITILSDSQLSQTEPHTTVMEDLNMLLNRYQSVHNATSLLLSPDYAHCTTEDESFEPKNFEKLPNDVAFHSFLNKLHIELTACVLVLRCMADTVFLLEVGDSRSTYDLSHFPSCDTSILHRHNLTEEEKWVWLFEMGNNFVKPSRTILKEYLKSIEGLGWFITSWSEDTILIDIKHRITAKLTTHREEFTSPIIPCQKVRVLEYMPIQDGASFSHLGTVPYTILEIPIVIRKVLKYMK